MDKNKILDLLNKIESIQKEKPKDKTLPNNCYFLDENNVLSFSNKYGYSRYPYSSNGLTLWAYDSGYISINDSSFFLVAPTLEGKEPYFAFYGGIKNKSNLYDFYSITGAADTYLGSKKATIVIYNDAYALYIRNIDGIIFTSKMSITEDKRIIFSNSVLNTTNTNKEVYLSSYQNLMMMHGAGESEETKWFRDVSLLNDGATNHGAEDIARGVTINNYAVIKRFTSNADKIEATTSNIAYRGNKNTQLNISSTLENGYFPFKKSSTGFSESAIYGDLISKSLNPGEEMHVDYQIRYAFNSNDKDKLIEESLAKNSISNLFKSLEEKPSDIDFKLKFGKLHYELDNDLFNNFLASTMKQVNYCTKTKNSTLMLLGMRDIFQMVEASAVFNKTEARKKLVLCMNFIEESGRLPRQFSVPQAGENPIFDKREFIDQGQWGISAVYQYLAFTGDYSLLDEMCGFVDIDNNKIIDKKTTFLDHLKCITSYLLDKIDPTTGCLRTLYGDWNDAVDGLGRSSDPNQKFGDGVSVMASYHLYKNLTEMIEILSYNKDDSKYIELLKVSKEKLKESLLKYTIVSNDKGEKRIIHGWGESRSFYVGSYKDVDNKSRLSTTSNAFYVISGLNKDAIDMSATILNSFAKLDSKYGIRTFDEYFDKKDAYKVGRIVNLPRGTAENAATYIHAAMFATRAMFLLDKGDIAFKQLLKLIPITHENISVSSFIMPNSYGYNEDLGVNGESMNDWYTGSSNTILKALIFDMLGINPHIDSGLELNPIHDLPSDNISISLSIKGKNINYNYLNKHSSSRKLVINGKEIDSNTVDLSKYKESIISIDIID